LLLTGLPARYSRVRSAYQFPGSHAPETVKVFNLKDLTTKDTKSTKF
jgi:hypothetical protein